MPRSQIDTARLDAEEAVINVVGPLELDVPAVPVDIHVTLIQGDAYAHGHGTDTRAGGTQGTWTARAETVGTFDTQKLVEAFGIVVVAILNAHQGIPLVVLIFAVLLGIGGYILKETQFGLILYAVGNNDEAARRAGVDVDDPAGVAAADRRYARAQARAHAAR